MSSKPAPNDRDHYASSLFALAGVEALAKVVAELLEAKGIVESDQVLSQFRAAWRRNRGELLCKLEDHDPTLAAWLADHISPPPCRPESDATESGDS